MRDDLGPDDLDGLLERPLVAVLATRHSGGALLSVVVRDPLDGLEKVHSAGTSG
jgi:hypothetical protein